MTFKSALSPLTFQTYFHRLSLRQRVVISQLPLAVSMILVIAVGLFHHREIFLDRAFIAGLIVHGLILLACTEVPWQKLRRTASLAIPILDFIAISLILEGAGDALNGLAFLFVFPVIWLACGSQGLHSVAMLSFFGPLAAVWIPPLVEGAGPGSLGRVVLVPFMMLAVGITVRVVTASMNGQQRELEDKERLLNTIVETVGVGVVVVDKDGHDVLMNRQQRKNHHVAMPEDVDDPTESQLLLFRPDKETPVPVGERPVGRAVAGESFSDYLMWIGKEADRRAVSASARTMTDEAGNFAGSVIAFNDVSDLVSALAAKDDFVSNVSHEFRTPLTSILGYLDLAVEDGDQMPLPVVHYLDVARRNTERLLRLVSDLLATTSNSMTLDVEPTDIAALIENCLSSAQVRAEDAGIRLINEAEADVRAEVDPLRIGQVLDNLLSNAIKYSPGGGTVTVRAWTAGGKVLLRVSDTGMGMDQTDQAGAFTKFFRADSVRNTTIPGVGLGLLITKTIVDRHGGSIELESFPGVGTSFTLTLPCETGKKAGGEYATGTARHPQ